MTFVDRRLIGQEDWYFDPPRDYLMRIPDGVLKSVVFLGLTRQTEHGLEDVYQGTAFFVVLPSERVSTLRFGYLVTCRHVADAIEGQDYWVRCNVKGGGAINLKGAATPWHRHPDWTVDVAVLPTGIDKLLDHKGLSTRNFALPDFEGGIEAGDELYLVGLFALAAGTSRNTPIVRSATLAMIPDAKIKARLSGNVLAKIDAYIMEVRSFGGLSGSPVYIREVLGWKSKFKGPLSKEAKEKTLYGVGPSALLGIAQGHWHIDKEDLNAVRFRSPDEAPGVNLGLAIVVPASKIIETLDLPALAEQRRRLEDEILALSPEPVADNAMLGEETDT